jgi:hypothetical protein
MKALVSCGWQHEGPSFSKSFEVAAECDGAT